MQQTILVIDTGSSSMRGILFDPAGKILFMEQRKYTMTMGPDGSATMEAETFAHCLSQIATAAGREIRHQGYLLQGICLDSQRSSVLAVDREIRPLHPILMWYDKRCEAICRELSPEIQQEIYQTCGMRLTPVSSAPKMLWMKRNLPEIYENAFKLLGIHDYLLYHLTGQLVTDATCACRSALMDIHSFSWSERLLSLFRLDRDKLCDILPAGSIVGTLTARFSEQTGLPQVPVISGGGDQQCCLLGQGPLDAQTISVNSGSASYIAIPISTPAFDPKQEVNLSAYYGSTPWILEGSNMGTGTVYQWFNQMFYGESKDMTRINQEVLAQPPGCGGLICYPEFAGRGCPDTDPNARGIFQGIGLQHTRGSFARAILEGICFDIYSCITHMERLGIRADRIRSTGGMTNFPEFNQILADISGREVQVCSCPEATATGAFYAACRALQLDWTMGKQCHTQYLPDEMRVIRYRELTQIRKR